jgi:tetratricopeptide (TPR) repeat protein
MSKLLFLLFILISFELVSQTAPSYAYKEVNTRMVYEKLTTVIGGMDMAPSLMFIPVSKDNKCSDASVSPCQNKSSGLCPSCNARYMLDSKTIQFGEAMYDVTTKLGKDSTIALAFILGHELAHFNLKHDWGFPIGMYEDVDMAKKYFEILKNDQSQLMKSEAQADNFGMIFAYLAGFGNAGVGERFFQKFQSITGFPDKFSAIYPTFTERCELIREAESSLQKFVTVFETANVLMAAKKYDAAQQCLIRICNDFGSREMYNNLGVAATLATIDLMHPDSVKFVYPFSNDYSTRLQQKKEIQPAVSLKASSERGSGLSAKDLQKRLEKCAKYFEKAFEFDPEYFTAQAHLALVYNLQKEYELAQAIAGKVKKNTKDPKYGWIKAQAHIAKGIALAQSDEVEDALTEFNEAKKLNHPFAQLNIDILNKKFVPAPKTSAGNADSEEIGGVTFTRMNEIFSKSKIGSLKGKMLDGINIISIPRNNELNNGKIDIYFVKSNGYTAYCVEWVDESQGQSVPNRYVFTCTPPDFKGKSAKGIVVGSALADVEKAYGKPNRINASIQGSSLIYDNEFGTYLIVQLDTNSKVSGWTIFSSH